jgi:hypothetical protein
VMKKAFVTKPVALTATLYLKALAAQPKSMAVTAHAAAGQDTSLGNPTYVRKPYLSLPEKKE